MTQRLYITASADLTTTLLMQHTILYISTACVTRLTIVFINRARVARIKLYSDALVLGHKMSDLSVQNRISFLLISRIY